MVRNAVSCVLVAALLCAAAGAARADKPKISPAERKLAQRHFELASTYYQQAAYGEALKYFDKSYKLSGEPALLFNIGKCYEALGKLEQAIASYQAYLKATGSNPTIEARIRNLSARLPKRPAKASPPAKPAKPNANGVGQPTKPDQPPPTKPLKTAQAAPPDNTRPAPSNGAATGAGSTGASDSGGRTWSWWTGWVLVGAGVAAVGTSIALGVLAKNKADAVESAYQAGDQNWSDVQSLQDKGKAFQTGQIISLVAGIGLAAGGAALLLFLPRRTETSASSSVSVAPIIGAGVYGVGGTVRF